MKKIVTHGGKAHSDEFMACCLLFAAGISDKIVRHDCTPEDIDDPEIIVLDQGMQHDALYNVFDHHQFDRDFKAVCSVTLILEPLLGISDTDARKIWPWLEFLEWMDSKGPFQTAKHFGFDPMRTGQMQSPIETTILRKFQARKTVHKVSTLGQLMTDIGEEKLEYFHDVKARLELLEHKAIFHELHGFKVCDVLIPSADNPHLGLEMFLRDTGYDCPVQIYEDDRGPGIAMYRRGEDPRVDFSRIEGLPGVDFAHKNGFIAKLSKGVPWQPLLQASIVPQET